MPPAGKRTTAHLLLVHFSSSLFLYPKKRPFASLEDALVKTKIPAKVLKRFNFNTDSR
ncbi:hypothetical protein L915_17668 [Phytophthora nicotianae]|uniref:Uncharacterized protein n=1 Tax=Phytophthora nicotianae TaxID=4792 RepID=W2G0D3_PHYNI|nr:hypothetical protein L915_17668 [Phytophthora nicotianae]